MSAANTITAGELALDYLSRGWRVIPLPIRSKNPGYDGWQESRYTHEQLQNVYSATPANIGVLLGEPSGWLVDIDLDHPMAVKLARNYMLTTESEFGRVSKPESHFLYYVNEPIETLQRRLPNGQMICELRANGQTVFPGSVHPSGERITWHCDGLPKRMDACELRAHVNRLADAVMQELGIVERPIYVPPRGFVAGKQSYVPVNDRMRRCRAYVAKMPPAITGQGGHKATFLVALACFKFGLEDNQVLQVLQEFNSRCLPAWNSRDLAHKLESARAAILKSGEFGSRLKPQFASGGWSS